MTQSPLDDERVALAVIVTLLPCLISVWALPLRVMPMLVLRTVVIALHRDTAARPPGAPSCE